MNFDHFNKYISRKPHFITTTHSLYKRLSPKFSTSNVYQILKIKNKNLTRLFSHNTRTSFKNWSLWTLSKWWPYSYTVWMRPIFNINSNNNNNKSFILEKLGGLTYLLHLAFGSCKVLYKKAQVHLVTLELEHSLAGGAGRIRGGHAEPSC